MKSKKNLDRFIGAAAVVGSLGLVNVLGLTLFGRLDLTHDHQFTLSDATVAALREVHEPLTVRAYFTKDLPPPHSTNARYVKDLLEEYYSRGHGQLSYEFVDPAAEESSAEKDKKKDVRQDIFGRQIREATAMERELQEKGIPPVQVRVNQEDKIEVKRAYMGLVIEYNDRRETIPVVTDTAGLEYDLTTSIRKLTRAKPLKVGILSNQEGLSPKTDFTKAYGVLQQLFELSMVDASTGPVPADLDALLVVGPKTPLSAVEKRNLDAFLTSGHSAAFFLGPIKPNLQSLEVDLNKAGLDDLLGHYGVAPEPGLLVDAECATISVAQQSGFMRINQPVRYPLVPLPRSLENNTLTRGLAQVVFPFMSPLRVTVPADGPLHAEILVRSSGESWVQKPPYNLDPMQRWVAPDGPMERRPFIVSLKGPLESQPAAGDPTPKSSQAPEARLIVAGGATFVTDPFFQKANEALLLNMVDWLAHDDGLLAVRSRGLSAAPLQEVGEASRNGIKYANILGLPALFVGFGLVRWRRREARRHKIKV